MLKELLAVTALAMTMPTADASELLRLDIDQHGDIYEVYVEMEFDAPAEHIHALLTDYENLDRLNASITSSEIIQGVDPGSLRVRTRMHNCFLFFCMQLQKVEDVSEDAGGRILTVIDPAVSNFRTGSATWDIQELGERSRVVHHARLEPDLWMPPWIGTAILKDAIQRGIRESFANLDSLSRAYGRHDQTSI